MVIAVCGLSKRADPITSTPPSCVQAIPTSPPPDSDNSIAAAAALHKTIPNSSIPVAPTSFPSFSLCLSGTSSFLGRFAQRNGGASFCWDIARDFLLNPVLHSFSSVLNSDQDLLVLFVVGGKPVGLRAARANQCWLV
ncbi:hypothetical protein GUJ93_ZPchr0013g35806 [Zizania palustris]|uniref:Uncharacterized protein n=1 Tax=Zizania palustris TaxID=103762 RepID=A0A8J5WSC7_ZIZPA|nr:hypothetical protein GUJ93_ZPchr0013g35806 [Zizania palustris]